MVPVSSFTLLLTFAIICSAQKTATCLHHKHTLRKQDGAGMREHLDASINLLSPKCTPPKTSWSAKKAHYFYIIDHLQRQQQRMAKNNASTAKTTEEAASLLNDELQREMNTLVDYVKSVLMTSDPSTEASLQDALERMLETAKLREEQAKIIDPKVDPSGKDRLPETLRESPPQKGTAGVTLKASTKATIMAFSYFLTQVEMDLRALIDSNNSSLAQQQASSNKPSQPKTDPLKLKKTKDSDDKEEFTVVPKNEDKDDDPTPPNEFTDDYEKRQREEAAVERATVNGNPVIKRSNAGPADEYQASIGGMLIEYTNMLPIDAKSLDTSKIHSKTDINDIPNNVWSQLTPTQIANTPLTLLSQMNSKKMAICLDANKFAEMQPGNLIRLLDKSPHLCACIEGSKRASSLLPILSNTAIPKACAQNIAALSPLLEGMQSNARNQTLAHLSAQQLASIAPHILSSLLPSDWTVLPRGLLLGICQLLPIHQLVDMEGYMKIVPSACYQHNPDLLFTGTSSASRTKASTSAISNMLKRGQLYQLSPSYLHNAITMMTTGELRRFLGDDNTNCLIADNVSKSGGLSEAKKTVFERACQV